jgi:hypothetical protein
MLAAILLIAFAAYVPTLADWFSGDDFWFLRADQTNSVGHYVVKSFDFRETGTQSEFDRYRPLYPIAWRLQYAVFGLHAFYYHAVLLALHLGCTALVWLIARRLLAVPWAASLAALVFAIHPAYAGAVAWISGGNRLFVALPYLLSLLLFMQYADRDAGPRATRYWGAFVCFIAAVLFHSSAITLAVVFPAYMFLVAGEPRDAMRPRAWIPFVPYALVTGVSFGIQYWVRDHLGVETGFRFGFHQYANYAHYLGMTLVPFTSDNFANAEGSLINALQGLASLLMLGLTFALLARRPASRTAIFVVFWAYVSLLPDSTLVLGAFGRVMYMPGASLAVFLVLGLLWLRDAAPARLRDAGVRAAPYVLVFALGPAVVATYGRYVTTSHDGGRNLRFAEELRVHAPAVPAGGTLYVAGAPSNVLIYGSDSRLADLVRLYLGDVQVRAATAESLPQGAASLSPDDRLFTYTP